MNKTTKLNNVVLKEGALMIKGNRRIVAMILVAAMILTMVPVAAFAHKVSPTPSKTPVAIGATSAAVSSVTVEETATDEFVAADKVVTVTLKDKNDGSTIHFANIPTVSGANAHSLAMTADTAITFTINGTSGTDAFTISNINYKVDTNAPTGDVKFEVAVAGGDTNTYSNATVVNGIAVSRVGTKTTLSATGNSQSLPGVTVKLSESAAAQFQSGNKIKLTLEPADVTWTAVPTITATGSNLELGTPVLTDAGKAVEVTVNTASTATGTVEFGNLKLDVGSAAPTGDIKVAVSNTGSAPVNPTSVAIANLTVSGTIAASATALTVTTGNGKSAGTITLTESQKASFATSPALQVKLLGGVTFQSAPTASATGGITFAVGSNSASSTAGSLNAAYDTASWTINAQSTSAGVITVSPITINIPAGTTGDIKAEISGGGISGTKTVTIASLGTTSIATVAATSKPSIKVNMPNQAGGDITITEAAAGSLATGGVIYLTIFGQNSTDNAIIFGQLPTAKVISGDIVLGTVGAASTVSTTASAEKFTIKIPVTTKSGSASTIKLTDIKYDVTSKAVSGDIVLDVRYIATDTGFANASRLATVANGIIGTSAGKFSDVPATHWAFNAIEYLAGQNIINGRTSGLFDPNANITRAEFAKIACLAAGLSPVTASTASFSDISGHWAAGYIEAVKKAGIVGGYPDGTFRPNANITRAEIAKIVVGAAKFTVVTSGASFSDISSNWAKDYIITAAVQGVVTGYTDGTFRPSNNATRAEASQMVYKWLVK